MQKIVIEGRHKLKGTVKISGAKNAALPCLFASLLTDKPCYLENVPRLRDIKTTLQLLSEFDVSCKEGKRLTLHAATVKHVRASYELVKTMRASVLALGPLLARTGVAEVSLPGGCAIGARPINLHLEALKKMGAQIDIKEGYVHAKAKRLQGAKIYFDDITVTGTENIMMAACLAKGETVIENAACEPEIPDLAGCLKAMGAVIEGAGTNTIRIQGVDALNGGTHKVIPDRIEMGTFMIAAAITGSTITISGGRMDHVEALVAKLEEAGVQFSEVLEGVCVKGLSHIRYTDINTAPYPGFATDFQAQFMALMCLAEGSSVIVENIFENRFMHVAELNRMGANIKIEGNSAFVMGVKKLSGAPVMASDLRASAALILAGLAADGITEVHRIYHIDRGYDRIEHKLRQLGARIKRTKVKF
jgi:UDP-N-acetylglucosamine 1-carboxyvinyltransferase